MQKNPKAKPGLEGPDSHGAESTEKSETLSNVNAVMAALKNTGQSVLTKMDSSLTAVADELHKKIGNLLNDLKSEITSYLKQLRIFEKKPQRMLSGSKAWRNNLTATLTRLWNSSKVTTLTSQVTRLPRPKTWNAGDRGKTVD